jgi:glucose/arabinose dehydrogenase
VKRTLAVTVILVGSLLLTGPTARAAGIGATPVVTGLDFPATFAFAPDGRIFYADTYTGEIHIFDPSNGSDNLFFTLTGVDGTQGVIGLAIPPDYATRPLVYAYVTRTVPGPVLKNQIVRIRNSGGVGTQPKIIYTSDAGTDHFGGRMLFGPDGLLYVVVGDGGTSANSQILTNTNGKILRMTTTGQVPPGNPFAGSLIWVYGIRNSIGFAFDPQSGNLWEDDNGPECNDEINLIQKGRNYGWGPTETCSTPPPPPRNTNQDGPSPVLPIEYIASPTAPTGAMFCSGCGLTGAEGALFYGNFNTGDIHEVVLTADRRHIASDNSVFTNTSVVLSVERGPDGALYFSDDTSIYKLIQT